MYVIKCNIFVGLYFVHNEHQQHFSWHIKHKQTVFHAGFTSKINLTSWEPCVLHNSIRWPSIAHVNTIPCWFLVKIKLASSVDMDYFLVVFFVMKLSLAHQVHTELLHQWKVCTYCNCHIKLDRICSLLFF